jgi:hypothetical protein
MFRVHLPATSYLKKQVKFFDTLDFLKAYKKHVWMNQSASITKSAGLTFGHELAPHSWAPTDAGLHPDPDTPDHPPWNHHPETGELLPGGLHPIDFIHRDLQQRLHGPDKVKLTAVQAADLIDEAIDLHNREAGENHQVPSFGSPQWRKVFVGPHYPHKEQVHMRKVRGRDPLYEGGPRPFITYFTNSGNVDGAAQGQWIDSGAVHINQALKQVMEKRGFLQKGLSENQLPNYVRYNALKPGSLSGGIVQSVGTKDFNQYQQTGQLPEFFQSPEMQAALAEQRRHPQIHAHQLAQVMPDAFYYAPTGRVGGRPPTRGGGSDIDLKGILGAMGVEHGLSDKDLEKIAGTRIMKLLFQGGHGIDAPSGSGAVKELVNLMLRDINSHPKDEYYPMHASHARGAETDESTSLHRAANLAAGAIVAHMSNAAHKLMMQGMPEDEAKMTVARQMRYSEVNTKGRFAPEEGLREKIESLLTAMLNRTGHDPVTMDSLDRMLGEIPTDPEKHHLRTPTLSFDQKHDIPKHWVNRVVFPYETAPQGDQTTEEAPPLPPAQPPAPAPAPPMGGAGPGAGPGAGLGAGQGGVGLGPAGKGGVLVTSPTGATLPPSLTWAKPTTPPVAPTMRQAAPFEEQYMQARNVPREQTFFDIGTGAVVQRSDDVVSSLDEIRKKMGYFDGFLRGLQP